MSDAAPSPARPGPGAGRPVARGEIREELARLLPGRGVLAAGGGFVSSTWRVVVDFDERVLEAARGDVGADVAGALADAQRLHLTADVARGIESACLDLLAHDRTEQSVMSTDAVGLLVVVDGDAAWRLAPAGPITVGPPAELSAALHELAWPPDDTRDSQARDREP